MAKQNTPKENAAPASAPKRESRGPMRRPSDRKGGSGARGGGRRRPENDQTAQQQAESNLATWKPKTALGQRVKDKEITDIDEILESAFIILEPEIVDSLVSLENDLLLIGQSKGKFGGGARRVFRQTQKKTKEGNKPKFSTLCIVGDRNGHLGIGMGKAKETVPAREKSLRNAKLKLFKIRRGCGSWECNCATPHSIPFAVEGKCGSLRVKIMPAPKGKGICAEKEVAKVLSLAGIKDAWTKTQGQTVNKVNFVFAVEDALRALSKAKIKPEHYEEYGIIEGSIKKEEAPENASQSPKDKESEN